MAAGESARFNTYSFRRAGKSGRIKTYRFRRAGNVVLVNDVDALVPKASILRVVLVNDVDTLVPEVSIITPRPSGRIRFLKG